MPQNDAHNWETILNYWLVNRQWSFQVAITYLALTTVVHGTRSQERLCTPKRISQHEILESRVQRWRVAGYLGPIPRNSKGRWPKIGDETPKWLQHWRCCAGNFPWSPQKFPSLSWNKCLAEMVPVIIQESVQGDARTEVKYVGTGSYINLFGRHLVTVRTGVSILGCKPVNRILTEISRKNPVTKWIFCTRKGFKANM